MTDSQWQLVKEITVDAFDLEPALREPFVSEACGGDDLVRTEVFRLLNGAQTSAIDMLSEPAHGLGVLSRVGGKPVFASGIVVASRFRVERFLNRGGMGEVYAATDLELHETVALKTISPHIATSPDVIQRFKREVRESRRVSHHCVCRVYELFSHQEPSGETVWFLSMELLEGEALSRSLAGKQPVPSAIATDLIGDMVGALAAAHALGIVHRDFKPGNIMIVPSAGERDRAVVTDFGLAVNLVRDSEAQDRSRSGTPAYMAPEQAAGGEVAFPADQFSLGMVVAEMLTGSRPVPDRSSEEAFCRSVDEWFLSPAAAALNPPARTALRRCLAFRPEHRFPSVTAFLPALLGTRAKARKRRLAAGVIFLVAALAAFAAYTASAPPQVVNSAILTPETGLAETPGISRDGRWIVYASNRAEPGNLDIWIQPSVGGPARRLTTDPAVDEDPVVSPDGKVVFFTSERDSGGLYRINSDGTGERLVAQGGRSPSISPDGRFVAFWHGTRDDVAPSGRMFLLPVAGGDPVPLAADFADARYPTWNSDGKHIMFDGCRDASRLLANCTDWWVIRPDGSDARDTGAVARLGSRRIRLQTPTQRVWRGDHVYFSAGLDEAIGLWDVRLSSGSLRASPGLDRVSPVGITEREPALAADGAIVFGRITAALHIRGIPLTAAPTEGSAETAVAVTTDPSNDGCPSISRDGRRLFFNRRIRGMHQLLSRDIASGAETTVVESPADKFWPVASADGTRVAFEVRSGNSSSIWLAEAGASPRPLCQDCGHPTSWFGNENAMFHATAAGQIALLDISTGASRVVVAPAAGEILGGPDWNPVNQYLIFTASMRGGPKSVFAVPFPVTRPIPVAARIPLTGDSFLNDQPRWASDGSAFYYLSRRDSSNCVWGRRFKAGRPVAEPFPVMHFHDLRFSPDRASPLTRGLTVGADSIYLSVGEVTEALWAGTLVDSPIAGLLRRMVPGFGVPR